MVTLKVSNVSLSYSSVKVLNNVTFSLEENSVISLLGPNGSGKTTLLKTIDGLLRPNNGSVYVNCKLVHQLSRKDVAKLLGYVPQKLEVSELTAFEFVLTARRPYVDFDYSKEDKRIALDALKEVGMLQFKDRLLTELSGGQLQKIYIARALASGANVLLFDEPTSNLDPKASSEVMRLLKRISLLSNKIIIISIHDLTLAYRYSDISIFLKDGKIVAIGKTDEVFNTDIIKLVYEIDAEVDKNKKIVIFYY
ncbi:ABC transporter ATP-binding protein [Acidianus ambivalens]|uniref:ATP-binding cassette domain-containing protein n=1 Tax=Acidianus ambivalens TaxID=2283 RepID=A0A650CVS9_ACIAM|nr:ABC transporter ATP-binding protein [Acidianus ambivalens]MQL56525.1 ATP-binding cassette domain-containing protein [Acidianus ambivalens]QGR21950.1 ATP-binding cassette domain-containing protein [Acidianus ambivalens]